MAIRNVEEIRRFFSSHQTVTQLDNNDWRQFAESVRDTSYRPRIRYIEAYGVTEFVTSWGNLITTKIAARQFGGMDDHEAWTAYARAGSMRSHGTIAGLSTRV